MSSIELSYQFCVVAISLLVFFMKFSARNDTLELVIKIIGKVVPLFCLLYASISILKHFGAI